MLGFTIGETTTLRFLPSESDSLNWEGTLKVKEDSEIGVGSFAVGPIAVDVSRCESVSHLMKC